MHEDTSFVDFTDLLQLSSDITLNKWPRNSVVIIKISPSAFWVKKLNFANFIGK